MALKEKALKRLGEKLTRAGIPFCAAGPWMLCQRGWNNAWHGFDIVVDPQRFEEADHVLTRLGMRTPLSVLPENAEVHYHFDGADIVLYAGFSTGDTAYHVSADADTAAVLGQNIPLMSPEDWYVLLLSSGRQNEALAVLPYFREHPFRRDCLASTLSHIALPESLFNMT